MLIISKDVLQGSIIKERINLLHFIYKSDGYILLIFLILKGIGINLIQSSLHEVF